ncbi:type II toxin-antitoxin system Phd/YefM family antitoxin [Pseudolysinimonas sp.]|uniref:type II toxin-antitoxin system Phd/YefM family antitoxin n=1 Tax=Pseudolysinimonas sp. TaxID=2680009 RepID=UPI00286B5961|nr:type II toxin-antitoxin system Phd/YefM family antitoxin [Pseudolysinimonas sp.]
MSINIYEAKTQLSKLIARVEEGEEITISRNGRPAARLVPIERRTTPRVPGALKGQFWMSPDFDDFTEQDEADWYGEG